MSEKCKLTIKLTSGDPVALDEGFDFYWGPQGMGERRGGMGYKTDQEAEIELLRMRVKVLEGILHQNALAKTAVAEAQDLQVLEHLNKISGEYAVESQGQFTMLPERHPDPTVLDILALRVYALPWVEGVWLACWVYCIALCAH